jgi:Carbohydrate binding module (family 6)
MLFRVCLVNLVILLSIGVCSSGHAEDFNAERFEKTTVCANLIQPMEMAIAPDGTIFLIELAGTIKSIDPSTGKANLRYNDVNLDQVGKITVRAASAGAGGTIEVHRAAVDGPLLGMVMVEVNGDWHSFIDKTIDITAATGRDDIYLVFKNPVQRAGLMNIDSVEFAGKGR